MRGDVDSVLSQQRWLYTARVSTSLTRCNEWYGSENGDSIKSLKRELADVLPSSLDRSDFPQDDTQEKNLRASIFLLHVAHHCQLIGSTLPVEAVQISI